MYPPTCFPLLGSTDLAWSSRSPFVQPGCRATNLRTRSYRPRSSRRNQLSASLRSGDGVHYTDDGARVVAKAIWEAIKKDWQTP